MGSVIETDRGALPFARVHGEPLVAAAAFVSYGSLGGSRAIEHLRGVCSELQIAHVRQQLSFSLFNDFENFSTVVNIDYELVPGLHIQPEVGYLDNFADRNNTLGNNGGSGSGFNGFLRIQRNF